MIYHKLLLIFIFIQLYVFTGTLLHNWTFNGVSRKKGSSRFKLSYRKHCNRRSGGNNNFLEANRFHVEMKVGERGKYTRDPNTNIAWRNYNVIERERLLCYKIRDEREQICFYFQKI
jgi:hypothetical protein